MANLQSGKPDKKHNTQIDTRRENSAGRVSLFWAWLAEAWERLWPLLVPGFIVFLLFAICAWSGLWRLVPDWVRYGGMALFGFGFIVSLLPLRHFSLPNTARLLARIEAASQLKHQPLSAQNDRPIGDDPEALSLWREHQARMKGQLTDLSSGVARPDGNRFDAYALRALLLVPAVIAWSFSFSSHGGKLGDIFSRHYDVVAIISRADLWVTPPSYTRLPPIYLTGRANSQDQKPKAADRVVKVPTGSKLHLRYVGEENIFAEYRNEDGTSPLSPISKDGQEKEKIAGQQNFESLLERTGTIAFKADDRLLAEWRVEIIEDNKPQIKFVEKPVASEFGALEFAYEYNDDYGVKSAKALIGSLEPIKPGARSLVEAPDFALGLSSRKTGTGKVSKDLTDHPMAGSKVEIRLEVTDEAGQTGLSEAVELILPGRDFYKPLAKALIEERRILALDANQRHYVISLLGAVSQFPEEFEPDLTAHLAMETIYQMLVSPKNRLNDDKLHESLALFWETALGLELGDLSLAERKLKDAQEKLAKALEDGASDEEIEKLMKELRQAMKDYMEQLARQLAQAPLQAPNMDMSNLRHFSQREFERMMDRIEDLSKSGSKDAAKQLLSQMQRMLDQMMAGQPMPQNGQQQQQGNQLNQALDQLSELMQRQRQLMDETYSMEPRQPQKQPSPQNDPDQNQGQGLNDQQELLRNLERQLRERAERLRRDQNGQQRNSQNHNQTMTEEEFAEAMKNLKQDQEALRKLLDELGKSMQDLGLDPSKPFGEADKKMGEAEGELGDKNPGSAAQKQAEVLDALRQGAETLMQQLAEGEPGQDQQFGQQFGQRGQGRGGQRMLRQMLPGGRDGFDPLGRKMGEDGNENSVEGAKVPEQSDVQRALDILNAIRRKLSEPQRPKLERNYLEQLLEWQR